MDDPAPRVALPATRHEARVTMEHIFDFDAYAPRQIAERVCDLAVAKTRLPLLSLVMLGILAGAFIGLGALAMVVVHADASLGFAAKRVVGGLVFSLGLFLVLVAGAELFTGNNLLNGGAVGETYVRIMQAKVSLPPLEAFFSGVMCNVLVCMAVWMALAGRSVVDKLVAVVPPITAFVAAGFEHSIANMYLIPMGMMLQAGAGEPVAIAGLWRNLGPVIAGNLVGGSVLVGLVYYVIYVRPRTREGTGEPNR